MDPRKNVYKQYKTLGLHTPGSSTKWAGRVTKDTRGRQIHNMPEYTVEGGEYFSDKMSTVARDNAVSLEQLKAANPQITHEDKLSPGQRLSIPHSTKAPKVYKDWKPTRGKKTPIPRGIVGSSPKLPANFFASLRARPYGEGNKPSILPPRGKARRFPR